MKRSTCLLSIGSALAALTLSLFAAGPRGEGPTPPELTVTASSSPAPLAAPGSGRLQLAIQIPTGYHLFGGESLGAEVKGPQGVTFGKPKYPKGTMEEDQEVLRGKVVIEVPVTIAAGDAKSLKGSLLLDWQGCQDFGEKVCFLPTQDTFPFEVPLAAAPLAPPSTAATAPPASAATPSVPPPPPPAAAGPAPKPAESGYQQRFADVAKSNVPLALLLAFLFGVLSSLTPCVYPVIPITVAYIGSRSEGRGRFHGLYLSCAFVLGLSVVYAALGAISAKAGQAFGALAQTPWVGLPVAVLFFALALSMFNLFEFKTPSVLTTRIERTKQKGRGKGFAGAIAIGALSGLVASPCIGPLILAILAVVASTGSVLLGFSYLFAFALGMGVLFIVIGTFSGVLASLPKSGAWMDGVRIFFGAVILGASFYFTGLYLPKMASLTVSLVALWIVILFLLFGAKKHFFTLPWRVSGILLSASALAIVLWILPAKGGATGGTVVWRADLASALAESASQKRPAFLDFRADWCVACVELEEKTWPDKEVGALLNAAVPVRLDMTKNTAENRALEARYSVMGLPTLILLGPDGKELDRFVGYKPPAEFVQWYRAAAGPGGAP
jgi:thioredoxin:protein disulfide reductase